MNSKNFMGYDTVTLHASILKRFWCGLVDHTKVHCLRFSSCNLQTLCGWLLVQYRSKCNDSLPKAMLLYVHIMNWYHIDLPIFFIKQQVLCLTVVFNASFISNQIFNWNRVSKICSTWFQCEKSFKILDVLMFWPIVGYIFSENTTQNVKVYPLMPCFGIPGNKSAQPIISQAQYNYTQQTIWLLTLILLLAIANPVTIGTIVSPWS